MPTSKICVIISICLVLVGLSAWHWRLMPTAQTLPDRPASNPPALPTMPPSAALPVDFPHPLSKKTSSRHVEEGKATWYADRFHGRYTASGEVYSKHKLTAAHPKLPFGSQVRVTHLRNGRSVIVTINDRGRFRKGRIIDLSRKAAEELQMITEGVAQVKVEWLEKTQHE